MPVWVSFTLDDDLECKLRSGEDLRDAVQNLLSTVHVDAVLVNCCTTSTCSKALSILKDNLSSRKRLQTHWNTGYLLQELDGVVIQMDFEERPLNGFMNRTQRNRRWIPVKRSCFRVSEILSGNYDGQGIVLPDVFANLAVEWRQEGAFVIGGCCGMCPDHIKAIASRFSNAFDPT